MYIGKEGMIFTPRYTFTSYDPETGVYEGLEIQATAEQVYQEWKNRKQIDICPEPKPKTLEELTKENEQLWETVQFLLKKTGMIGDEKNATT